MKMDYASQYVTSCLWEKSTDYDSLHFERILRPQWDKSERQDMHANDVQSLWFAISSTVSQTAGVELDDFPRFSRLVVNHRQKHDVDACFPRLVSFVGNTGAGKSTIIRMMLEKPWLTDLGSIMEGHEVPVVGDADSTIATSGDVHLYAEAISDSEMIDRPVFFVDCEGFAGGAQHPPGSFAHIRNQPEQPSAATGSRTVAVVQKMIRFIMGKGKKRILDLSTYGSDQDKIPRRDDVIRKLFPRLLYNFSDVVVFVVREQRALADRILEILNWASTSTSSALNRATRPRLVIAVNSAAQTSDWNSHSRRERFFNEHKNDMDDPNIEKLRQKLVRDGLRIETLEDLFQVHYAEVDVVYIPHSHIRLHFSAQLRELDRVIQNRSRESQEVKQEVGMLLQSQVDNGARDGCSQTSPWSRDRLTAR